MATTNEALEAEILTAPHTEQSSGSAGYKSFQIGAFQFERDEYFARITCPTGTHVVDVENFLRSMMRDVAWGL